MFTILRYFNQLSAHVITTLL